MENNSIPERIKLLKNAIDSTLLKTKRSGNDLRVMIVTKNATISQIQETKDAGFNLFGENYIKPASDKIPQLIETGRYTKEQFHLIGHLQSNKVKKAISLFSSIDSVDSLELAQEIARNIKINEEPFSVMLEIKTSNDDAKYGFSEREIVAVFPELLKLRQLEIKGLMTISTLDGDIDETRRCFRLLRSIKEKLEKDNDTLIPVLSMGMSEDYPIAIEEGSNMLRIGRAIFGGL